jgi:hypothetical protein
LNCHVVMKTGIFRFSRSGARVIVVA